MAGIISSIALRSARRCPSSTIRQNGNVNIRRLKSTESLAPSVKARQDVFQATDEMPIYVKGGSLDGIMYRLTMGCCVLSIGIIAFNLFRFTEKKGA